MPASADPREPPEASAQSVRAVASCGRVAIASPGVRASRRSSGSAIASPAASGTVASLGPDLPPSSPASADGPESRSGDASSEVPQPDAAATNAKKRNACFMTELLRPRKESEGRNPHVSSIVEWHPPCESLLAAGDPTRRGPVTRSFQSHDPRPLATGRHTAISRTRDDSARQRIFHACRVVAARGDMGRLA